MNTLETLQAMLIKDHRLTAAQVTPESLLADAGVDSLGVIELMLQIEDEFGITLRDDEQPALATVGDLVAYIDAQIAAQPKAPGARAAGSAPVR
jgi:acyl carrier protein